MTDERLFEVTCVLGKRIRTTRSYWEKIVRDKHPVMKGREQEVKETLQSAEEVRRSKSDPKVLLYYKRAENRYICVVARHLNQEGFVITAYVTDNIKEGETVWTRSE